MKKLLGVSAALVLALCVAERASAASCAYVKGEDRWGVKTSVVPGAFDSAPKPISLDSLMDTHNPPLTPTQRAGLEHDTQKRWAGRIVVGDDDGNDVTLHEGSMVSVKGYLYRARCQQDGDFHLEIGVKDQVDKKSPTCLIVEAPDPGQIKDTDLKAHVSQVRQKLSGLASSIFTGKGKVEPVAVTVTGQLFLDAHHIEKSEPGGGRGTKHCATNVWEIHPVTDIDIATHQASR